MTDMFQDMFEDGHTYANARAWLEGRQVVVVTGANTGIGRGTATALYANGATVVMACRSLDRAHDAKREIEAAVARGDADVCHTPPGASRHGTGRR